MSRVWIAISGIIFLTISCSQIDDSKSKELFTLLSQEQTGISFQNILKSTERINTYTYRNFYNGAGVAIGDLNNDGLPEIYFAGNQVENQLYLNKGNFQFEDITDKAGVGCPDVWSTGVSFADVNGDGFLDIYVCKSGPPTGIIRHNELFINNGDLTFTERAKEYGIDDTGLSNHAVFFDYDKDGDLDMYLLNNSLRTIGFYDLKEGQRDIRDPDGGNKLYKNEGKSFVDVSEEAGIYGSAIGFGLGVLVSDINGDGWQDIFVSNDFFERDYCYVNNQDGTFSEIVEKAMPEISMGSMGADIADINNDGKPEIYVTEMLPEKLSRIKTSTLFEKWDKHERNVETGYHYQYTRNMLQLNLGNDPYDGVPLFREISRLTGVHATDWSWGALLADFDNDGLKDIYVANGIAKDLTNHDYVNFYANNSLFLSKYKEDSTVITKLVEKMPSTKISNYFFKNNGGLNFSDETVASGLFFEGFSNGAAYGDLDNDGDLDLVVSNIDDQALIYRNETNNGYLKLKLTGSDSNTSAIGTKIYLFNNDSLIYYEHNPSKGYMSSMDHQLVIGVGEWKKIDSISVIWPNLMQANFYDIEINKSLHLNQKELEQSRFVMNKNSPDLLFKKIDLMDPPRHMESDFVDFDRERLLFHMRSEEGPKLSFSNSSKLLFVPAGKGFASKIYEMSQSNFIEVFDMSSKVEMISEDVGGLFLDADADGDDDLLVYTGSKESDAFSSYYYDRLYFNENDTWILDESFPKIRTSTSIIKQIDYDNDGDNDLLIAERLIPFNYGASCEIKLLENNKGFQQVLNEKVYDFKDLRMLTDIEIVDINNDGWDDVVAVGEWMSPSFFINNNGFFKNQAKEIAVNELAGLYKSVSTGDFNEDGKPDFIFGNLGNNTRLKATKTLPLTLFINDFDKNGTIDHLLCQYEDEKLVPLTMLDQLLKQLPVLKKKYVKFEDYADQSIFEMFDKKLIDESLVLEVHNLSSLVLLSGNKGYTVNELPLQAQISSIYDIEVLDVNGDQHLDVLLVGNQTKVKPELGAYRASRGQVFIGDGKGNFQELPIDQSGFVVEGDARSIETIEFENSKYIIVGLNNDKIELFEYGKGEE